MWTRRRKLKMNERRSAYPNERAMYPDVCGWLEGLLKARFRKAQIYVADTSGVTLANYLEQAGFAELFPDYQTFEINVDVTGVVQNKKPSISFVECKITTMTLRDLSQLLGYSRVARPACSILVSPAGISKALALLLRIYRRYDVLEYADGKRLQIGIWDAVRKTVDPATLIPPGAHLQSLAP